MVSVATNTNGQWGKKYMVATRLFKEQFYERFVKIPAILDRKFRFSSFPIIGELHNIFLFIIVLLYSMTDIYLIVRNTQRELKQFLF